MESTKRQFDCVSPASSSDSPPVKTRMYESAVQTADMSGHEVASLTGRNVNKPAGSADSPISLVDDSAPDYFNKAMIKLEKLLTPLEKLDKIDNILIVLSDFKVSIEAAHNTAQDAIQTAQRASVDVKSLQRQLDESNRQRALLEEKVNRLSVAQIDQQDYSRRDNLIFGGIPQSVGPKQLETKVRSIMTEMGVANTESIRFERVHRLNVKENPKPVIVRFNWFKDRQRVWKCHRNLTDVRDAGSPTQSPRSGSKDRSLNATGPVSPKMYVAEDFAPETKQKRKKLHPILKAAINSDSVEEAYLVRDRLIIDGKVFTVDNLGALPEELKPHKIAEKEDDSTLVFWGRESVFSNFYKAPFVIGSEQYNCVEQFLCASKAKLFHDKEALSKIMSLDDPSLQKSVRVRNFDKQAWSAIMEEKAELAIKSKLEHHPRIQDRLDGTRGKILAEAASSDYVWGTGTGIFHEDALSRSKWKGKNLLGKLWMRIRDT